MRIGWTQGLLAVALGLACQAPGEDRVTPNAVDLSGGASAGAPSLGGSASSASPLPSKTRVGVALSAADAVPDSAWVDVNGLTLVGFYPMVTNEQLERDEDLATVLDDFSYHLGTATDSLTARGVRVHLRGGDTLWLRTGADQWRFIRPGDSADVGYVFADTLRRRVVLYGVRTYVDLIEDMDEFRRTGQVRPR